MTAPIESEIFAAFDQWTTEWNNGNITGYLEAYLDAPYTRYVSGKTILIGRENIVSHFQNRGAVGTLFLAKKEIDFVSETNAQMFGEYVVKLDDGTEAKGCFTVYLQKIEEGWKIVYDHSS